ncbi:MAG TPA: hypothetical protein VGR14_17190 [Verrucomicrobiae bacterium]|jgi:hypothetical protein|nr:hypothetical protein [Verrucomicrobiae bacterium]
MPMGGPSGHVRYYEGASVASFYWEFGGGDIVAIIYIGQPSEWGKQHPWAADRRHEILERMIQEVIRQRAPTCKADIDEKAGYVYLREQKPAV